MLSNRAPVVRTQLGTRMRPRPPLARKPLRVLRSRARSRPETRTRRSARRPACRPSPRPADLLERPDDRQHGSLHRLQVRDRSGRVDSHAVPLERLPRAHSLASPRDAHARARRGELGHSRALSDSTRPRSWCTKLIPSSRNCPGASGRRTGSPSISSSPSSGSWKPTRILTSVDLPEPFSPTRP